MRYLGLDLGKRKLGVAISDKLGIIASFYASIISSSEDEMLSFVMNIIEKEKIDCVVIGLPKNMDNSLGFRVDDTITFKEKLEKKFSGEIVFEDERLTTVEAERVLIGADMSRKKRKTKIDGISAVIILQSYLNRKEK